MAPKTDKPAPPDAPDAPDAASAAVKPLKDEWWRRPFDVAFALAVLVLASPVMLLTAALVKLTSRGPVLFRQERSGRGGAAFRIAKFRTMVAGAESMGAGLAIEKDDRRITAVGRCVRRLGIDELPQMFNILAGSMSVVGPRPLPARYLQRYSPRQRSRLRVKPGITGWSTVRLRNMGTWEERLELDAWYVENRRLLLDLRIILETPPMLIFGRGAERAGGGVGDFSGEGGGGEGGPKGDGS